MSFTSGQILTASQLNTFAPGTRITNADGSASAPSYSFSTDDNTGFYVTGNEGRIRFVGDGTPGGWLSNTGIRTVDGSASVPSYSFTSDSNTGMFRSADDEIQFVTGGSARVTVQSDGQTGIGTTTPFAPLQVFNSSTDTVARFGSGDAGVYISFYDNTSASETNARIGAFGDKLVLLAGGSDRMVIASDGDTAIGTTTPAARLHVNSGTTNTVAVFESTDSGAIVAVKDNNTSGNAYNGIKGVGNSLVLRANNSDQVTIATDGSIRATDASASAPTYTFASDPNTGFFVTGNNGRIHFTGNGTAGGYLLSTGGRFIAGSATTPSYAFKDDTNTGMYRSGDDQVAFTAGGVLNFQILNNGVFVPSGSNYFGVPSTGTGNDAEWASTGFGTFLLQRNSSLTAEKENITADLGTHLTADMIDSVVPKLWNRTNAPGYPEIGPLAEDMDAISPFLAAHGADIRDGTYQEFLTGINKTAYLSLLVLAVKDLRTRVAALESA